MVFRSIHSLQRLENHNIHKLKHNIPRSVSELSHNSENSEIGVRRELEKFFQLIKIFFEPIKEHLFPCILIAFYAII